ncbi:interleukin-1 receptor-associated kinase 1 isoform X2 [Brachypodium distachyon]|uniref:Protein kinase domain-containing protein n=1 Tax=Brachypodium distachyon TaxID=15368 RepID=A0A0Q3J5J7_BRADI|nr:interleukin-1 receptor-associated kinase 1 isoform X2 [Brachypodium distachyon]KQK07940.1 hypothetical protein BRADI_2g38510v3 [Brachypodium distachyon]|eukprot:XP_014754214.1 interleukin-1 receptor-associated kinase 1 isoform X2 [Brachypodium distachyon]
MASPSSNSDGDLQEGLRPCNSNPISRDTDMDKKLQNAASLTFRLLQEITDNFSEGRKIGQGAYGTVYKGVYDNGEEIAVKLLHNNMQGTDDGQFKREFENLMRLEHQNVVRLVGYCYETQHKPMLHEGETIFADEISRALCFEYMPNGSLTKHISEECDGLDWNTRYKIIKGACEGLKYLHEGFKEPIYHMDLKPDNILLDENMMPKLADFGLSKLYDGEQTMITQTLMGTVGYLPPEYLFEHIVSKKLDIFSLGVVITKIIAGPRGPSRRAEMTHQEFLDQVHENWRKRLQETWRASRTLEAYCEQVNTCIEIALGCMETDRHNRPTIVHIIHQLNKTETVIKELKNDQGAEPSGDEYAAADPQPLPIPSIYGLRITGEAFPGGKLQASGYSISGTTSVVFQWVRHLEDGSVYNIEDAACPTYLVTGDDVGTLLAVEVQPLVDQERKGETVKVYANEKRKIMWENDSLPSIDGLRITGEAFPGRELTANGYSINGTTLCNFQWVHHLEDGSVRFIKDSTNPTHLVTDDDVDTILAVEVQPLNEWGRKGEIVKVYANEQRKITDDPEMKELIKTSLSIGHASYEVLLPVRYLDMWEPAVLAIKREGYSIKCNGQRGVVITEKFQQATAINIPYGRPTEFSIQSADGAEYNLKPAENSPSRDFIVQILRSFRMQAVQNGKGRRKGNFFMQSRVERGESVSL